MSPAPWRRCEVKLEEGASGEGNATFRFAGAPAASASVADLEAWVGAELPRRLECEAEGLLYERYASRFDAMGGVAEAWIEGPKKYSPSAQLRINALGELEPVSTHDQVLGGPAGQVFLGARFPAAEPYRLAIQDAGLRVGATLRARGVLGRFSVDFVSLKEAGRWRHIGIEINLRKGGTTHTFQTLQYLTDGRYDPASGLFLTPQGAARYYYATDNLVSAAYRALTPPDLIDLAVEHDLHFDPVSQCGVTFNLIGAVSRYGKLGVVSIAGAPAEADALYRRTVQVLDASCAGANSGALSM
jgi:hypothetical protein